MRVVHDPASAEAPSVPWKEAFHIKVEEQPWWSMVQSYLGIWDSLDTNPNLITIYLICTTFFLVFACTIIRFL